VIGGAQLKHIHTRASECVGGVGADGQSCYRGVPNNNQVGKRKN
jgi:hypothetical protein